jgi:outer membrane protein assembly factor BamB
MDFSKVPGWVCGGFSAVIPGTRGGSTRYRERTKYSTRELVLKLKFSWPSRIAFLLALIIAIGLVSFGCISGLASVGWSGGTVYDNVLYVGSREGRLVAVNLSDDSRLFSEAMVAVSQTGLFGCAPATGGSGCAGGSASVPVYGTPVVSDNLTYIAGYNGKVYAYNIDTLAVRWVYPREGNLDGIVGGVAVAQGKVIFGCSDGKVYALDATTGDYQWASAATGDKIWGTPAVDGDTLYIGSFDKKLYALNIADGSVKWEYATEGSIIATPLIYNGMVIFGSFDRNLYAVNTADGSLKWQFRAGNFFWAEPIVYNDKLYVGCLDNFVYVLSPSTGAEIAEFDLHSPVASQPVVVAGSVIFANTKGVVYSIDTATGEMKTLVDLKKTVNGPLTASGEIVYIHTQDLMLQRVNAATGALLSSISLSSSG